MMELSQRNQTHVKIWDSMQKELRLRLLGKRHMQKDIVLKHLKRELMQKDIALLLESGHIAKTGRLERWEEAHILKENIPVREILLMYHITIEPLLQQAILIRITLR